MFLGPPFSHLFMIFSKNCRFWDPHSKSDGVNNPLRVRGRTQQSASGRFSPLAVSLSCTAPYLTSPFVMLSHWVSVSAGNPAIAVARKVGFLGAPEIENGSPFSFQTAPSKSSKTIVFPMNFNDFHLHGRSFLAPFFGHRFA